MFNHRLHILLILFCYKLVVLPFKLPLYHFIMNIKEIVLSILNFDLLFQAFLRIRKLLPKVLVLFSFLRRGFFNKPIFPLDLRT
jgi:hypothetical protein